MNQIGANVSTNGVHKPYLGELHQFERGPEIHDHSMQ